MRVISAAQDASLAAPSRSTHVQVLVKRPSDPSFTNLSSLQGFDWVETVDVSNSVEQPTASCTLGLRRRFQNLSLAPLDLKSPINNPTELFQIRGVVEIRAAVLPPNIDPVASDWTLIFRGYIDTVDFTGAQMTVECRDEGAILMDTWAEIIRYYGDDDEGPTGKYEAIIQEILTNNATGVTVYSENGTSTPGSEFLASDSPGTVFKRHQMPKMPILNQLTEMSDLIGWVCRYKWQKNLNDYKLVSFKPPDVPVVVRTFTPSQYYNLSDVRIDATTVRNVVNVLYVKSGVQQSSYGFDAPSVAKYGRRFYEVNGLNLRFLDNAVEADALRNAMLFYFRDPITENNVTMPLFWPVELHDFYTFKANDVHYSADQIAGVIGYRHSFTKDQAVTTLNMRGRPAIGVSRRLRAFNRPLGQQIASQNTQPGHSRSGFNFVQNNLFSETSRG